MMVIYLFLINAASFLLMRTDKLAAKKHTLRIPEHILLFFACIGGSLGSTAAMILYRHKTRHFIFAAGLPVLFLIHLGIYMFFFL